MEPIIFNNQARNVPFQGTRASNNTNQVSSKNRQNSNQNRYHSAAVYSGQVVTSANQQQPAATQQALNANQQYQHNNNNQAQSGNYNGNNNSGYYIKQRRNPRGGPGNGNRNNQRQFRADTRANQQLVSPQQQVQYQPPNVNQINSQPIAGFSGSAQPNGVVAAPLTPQLATGADTRANQQLVVSPQQQVQYHAPIQDQINSQSIAGLNGSAQPNAIAPLTSQLVTGGLAVGQPYPDQPAYMPIDGMAPMGYFPVQPMPIGAYSQCPPDCMECMATFNGMDQYMSQFFMPTFQYLPAAVAPYAPAPISGYLMDTSLSPSTTPSSSDSNYSGSGL